jgi:hypothetical protein
MIRGEYMAIPLQNIVNSRVEIEQKKLGSNFSL